MTLRIGIVGATGRMGREIALAAWDDRDVEIAAAVVRPGHPDIGRNLGTLVGLAPLDVPLTATLPKGMGAVIDFSTAEATASRVAEYPCAAIGTTGLSDAQEAAIRDAARRVAIVRSANMSVGVHALLAALPGLAKSLSGFDREIIEAHHKAKKDAPSGTAKMLDAALGGGVTTHSVRAGGITGEHRVIFAMGDESIEVVHRAQSRRVFAAGAVRAAKFAAKAKPGLYSMADVLR